MCEFQRLYKIIYETGAADGVAVTVDPATAASEATRALAPELRARAREGERLLRAPCSPRGGQDLLPQAPARRATTTATAVALPGAPRLDALWLHG
jgi:hypothetical protein